MTPQEKANKKADFEILFKDSPEYFVVKNAKMIPGGHDLIRFICFTDTGEWKEDVWYPTANIHRIKKY